MAKIRPQYHLRQTRTGIDAWNVERLIELSKDLPVRMVDPNTIAELDENHWYFHDPKVAPTPRSIIDHVKLIRTCDLSHPIILDEAGRVMDGMHRICRAVLDNVREIPAVRFPSNPEPDFIDCRPENLPYDT